MRFRHKIPTVHKTAKALSLEPSKFNLQAPGALIGEAQKLETQ